MPFELFVALRYLRGKRKNRFVSLITIISVAGVCVGVMALIVVMSVMTGFDEALRDTIIGNRSHLDLGLPRNQSILDYEQAIAAIQEVSPHIVAAAPVVVTEALFQHGVDLTTGGIILGVDPELESRVTDLEENLTTNDGRLYGVGDLPGDKEIVLGYRLARRLGAYVGDDIFVYTAKPKLSPFGPRGGSGLSLTVSGISEAKMSDIDMVYAYVNLATAAKLTGRSGVDSIRCKLTNPNLADRVKMAIEDSPLPYYGETWFESQQEFFLALEQEKVAMFIILAFIILVAAFNITSTLIMIVLEKQRDIGILRTLGVSSGSVMGLFIIEGLLIGLGGTFAGVILGTIFAYYINPIAEVVAWILDVELFNSTIYYYDRIPSKIMPYDVAWITISAVVLSFISTLYPAWSASRLTPVDALRHE
ncbi:MAG: lipoprotein-releasing ABC transporter permease subunit [Candidatus Hydrogenedentes bacterium]|nr:lipoprotein-releasing ABC transporter permease subunit [Candidatus Hydrogenedentota bacterium]